MNLVMIMKKDNDIEFDAESDVDVYEVAASKTTMYSLDADDVAIRKFMMLRLLKIIPELENKILHGRIKDKETEKIRLDYIRQYINLCNCINNFTKDASYRIEKGMLKNYLDIDVADDFDFVENPE